ncbi:immunoglobulin-like domain-containing protein [Mediterraneibacter massiliensis]|uniref:immunoglobulin-like domain-containing protein n=1 Tax=Mediterraneibacter massiliensis TaxID=1720300 RepID=UPI0024AD2B1A|nr:immunoglobulin-like domain-containing protein [Mediterraneibacter massiliensis]
MIYCQGQMRMSEQASISGWTVYDTTSRADSRNAAVVLDGAKASFVMDGGEITGNYNVGSNAVAGAAVQVHNGASFVMNNGNIHDNGVIAKPKDNVHYGAGVFVYGENSSFKMTGGAIQSNDGMVGAGVYVYGSLNGKASFEMTGGKIDDNSITNVGKYACDGGGIYAKYAKVDILGKENAKISISNNGTKDFGTEYNSAQSSGGGIYAEKSTVNLNYVVIDHNTACGNNTQGGAGIWTKDSDVTIKGGSISNNQGGKYNQNVYGGALRIEGTGNVRVEAVTFENNRVSPESDYQWNVGHGGAIMMNGEDTLVLQDCVIKGNHASGSGGGIYANQGVTEIKGSTVIEGNTCNNNREQWKDWLGEAVCITSIATVKVYDQVQIDKENTVGLESDRNGTAVLTMANAYTGISEEYPVAIESMSQDVEQLPDTKGTPLVAFLDEAGGEQGAAYADEHHHFIVSSYMPATLHIGRSEENKNILTYVANRAPVIYAEDKTVAVGDTFKSLEGVSAKDAEDGDLTSAIEIVENEVDTSRSGVYKVTYQVTDSNGVSVTKTIKVTVKEKGTSTVPNDPDKPNKPNGQNTANTPGDNKTEAAGSVATGDHANMTVWIVLLAISGVGAFSIYRRKRKSN